MEADLELERRLRALPTHVRLIDADEAAIARLAVPPRRRTTTRRRPLLAPAVAVVLAVLVGGNWAASYFAPRYAVALASAPAVSVVSGPALRWAGLSADRLTVIGDAATVNGHTVRLVAGRADELRTVLFLGVDGVPPGAGLCLQPECTDKRTVMARRDWFPDPVVVTDQFGHAYGRIDNQSFEPLTGPAASVGARLTVRVETLTRPPADPGAGRQMEVARGIWTLHATLLPQPAPALTLPAPVQFEGNTYRITSARADGLAVLHFTVSGPAVDQARKFAYGPEAHRRPTGDPRLEPMGQLDTRYFAMAITGPDGRPALMHEYGYGIPRRGPLTGDATFVAAQPGAYRVHLGTGVEMTVTVPPLGG